ncbi:MAG: ROK family protein [Verrucomicrobiales bacterium]|nr:ROK family protein [Verrucomicrobiales bacterium]
MDALSPFLRPPALAPTLDPEFRPASLAVGAFEAAAKASGRPLSVGLAVEQADGSTFCFRRHFLPLDHPNASANGFFLERLAKFLLWSRGGWRIQVDGPAALVDSLKRYYQETPTGRFDSEIIGDRVYEKPLTIEAVTALPAERAATQALGRHWKGCRIGFDLGGSDRKVAAVIDGEPVFTEETVWDPVKQTDPQYHFDGIMDSLKKAAAHLPRVDAIGGSAAGVYVNNRPKVASLYRGIPPALFQTKIKNLFFDLKAAWGGIPFEVANDGEVTALAGSMAFQKNAVLGIAMGTSTAAGYVTPDGNITSWLNELAFVPVDYRPNGPRDEWSGDRGVGSQYFSQQAVGRLVSVAGIEADPAMPLPEKLKLVQKLMADGDPRAKRIYETLGAYFGYGLAHFATFYDCAHVLVLGRVMTGTGGEIILEVARAVLNQEFPELSARLQFHTPDETSKRHGQAVAAASLPQIP